MISRDAISITIYFAIYQIRISLIDVDTNLCEWKGKMYQILFSQIESNALT